MRAQNQRPEVLIVSPRSAAALGQYLGMPEAGALRTLDGVRVDVSPYIPEGQIYMVNSRSYADMLRDYLPEPVLNNELQRRETFMAQAEAVRDELIPMSRIYGSFSVSEAQLDRERYPARTLAQVREMERRRQRADERRVLTQRIRNLQEYASSRDIPDVRREAIESSLDRLRRELQEFDRTQPSVDFEAVEVRAVAAEGAHLTADNLRRAIGRFRESEDSNLSGLQDYMEQAVAYGHAAWRVNAVDTVARTVTIGREENKQPAKETIYGDYQPVPDPTTEWGPWLFKKA
jgi:hypothetical protein